MAARRATQGFSASLDFWKRLFCKPGFLENVYKLLILID